MCLFLLLSCAFLCFAGCGAEDASAADSVSGLTCEDALGDQVEFTAQELERITDGTMKVAVLNGSFAEIWSLAGGSLYEYLWAFGICRPYLAYLDDVEKKAFGEAKKEHMFPNVC